MSHVKDKWSQPSKAPPPLFVGQKERDLVKQVNDELIEKVIGQQVLYYPLSIEHSDYHSLYGEAINKTFMPPVVVYALVEWEGLETSWMGDVGVDRQSSIVIHFHKRRLTQDLDLFVRVGDFVLYGDIYYEIVSLNEPKQIFGQVNYQMEISAKCIRAREGLFDAQ